MRPMQSQVQLNLDQRPGLKQPSGCVASPKMASIPVEGSSFEIQSRQV
jgi:hypothetical protein